MTKASLMVAGTALSLSMAPAAQDAHKAATYITAEEVATVHKSPGVDRTIAIVDIGPENFAIATLHRGRTGAPPAAAGSGGGVSGAASDATAASAAAAAVEPCGERATT